jgi:hypothetical protein
MVGCEPPLRLVFNGWASAPRLGTRRPFYFLACRIMIQSIIAIACISMCAP